MSYSFDFMYEKIINNESEYIEKGIKLEKIASSVGYRSIKGFKLAFKKQFGDIYIEKI